MDTKKQRRATDIETKLKITKQQEEGSKVQTIANSISTSISLLCRLILGISKLSTFFH